MNIVFNKLRNLEDPKIYLKRSLSNPDVLDYSIIKNKQLFDFDQWFENYYEWLKNNPYAFTIHFKEHYIGNIGIREYDLKKQEAEMFIEIFSPFQNLGNGKESLKMFLNMIKELTALKKITLNVIEYNSKAINLYERFGFKKEGISKKHYLNNKEYNVIKMSTNLQSVS